MGARDLPAGELIDLALEAIAEQAPERLRPLLSPEISIVTERGSHDGIEAALAWAAKGYEHLVRRFVVETLEPAGDGLLAGGRVEYVWREGRDVGDATPTFLALRLDDGLLSHFSQHDTRAGALAALGG